MTAFSEACQEGEAQMKDGAVQALQDINLTIPERKVTAIVGASGSGKTTLIKLLLGFYAPNKGKIRVGELDLQNLNPHTIVANCV